MSILRIPMSKGQNLKYVKNGPAVFRSLGFNESLNKKINVVYDKTIDIYDKNIHESLSAIKKEVRNIKHLESDFNLFIGGDHSLSMGTISGQLDKNNKDNVVLWVDAHTDCNTFQTSPSMNVHGMPVSGILGLLPGPYKEFNCLQDNQIIYFGVRSIDKGEKELIKNNKIKMISKEFIDNNGIEKSIEIVEDFIKGKNIHISFDVDSLDPSLVSSTGTPEKNGLTIDDTTKLFNMVSKYDVNSMDIVEFNPSLGDSKESFININKIIQPFFNNLVKKSISNK